MGVLCAIYQFVLYRGKMKLIQFLQNTSNSFLVCSRTLTKDVVLLVSLVVDGNLSLFSHLETLQ